MPCNCDAEGSYNRTCNPVTGQCECRPGITGQHCDVCVSYQYGFSREGCKPCDCDNIGSQDLQCDASGQCPVHLWNAALYNEKFNLYRLIRIIIAVL